jgi:hypothetical protein
MPRIDVSAGRAADLLLDVQQNALSGLNTRLTQFAAAFPRRELDKLMMSLIAEDTAIGNAVDVLLFEFRTGSVCEQRSVWQGGVHARGSITRVDVNKNETDEGKQNCADVRPSSRARRTAVPLGKGE